MCLHDSSQPPCLKYEKINGVLTSLDCYFWFLVLLNRFNFSVNCFVEQMVTEEGGLEVVNSNHKWPKIVQRMGYSGTKSVGAALRSHYERIILPYDEFRLVSSYIT